ncbi:MAG: diguanylate cyclase (GGDEF)-like protein [Alphaproteobacteria bacterium]
MTDILTGLENSRALEEKLLDISSRLKRYPNQHCSLILFDLDHSKSINDNYGHGCSDRVLAHFAKLVSDRIRESDSLYRFGGEEFVVILDNTNAGEALYKAKANGRNCCVPHEQDMSACTASNLE